MSDVKPFCLLDNTMTLHGLRFLPEGGDMQRFKNNPILLYMHKRGEVHGKWNGIHLDNAQWLATPEFDVADPESAKIAGKVKRGFLKACSMGVYPKKIELINDEPWATEWEAIECSIVDAGSNANALMLCGPEGEVITDPEKIFNLTIPTMSKIETVPGADGTVVMAAALGVIALAVGLPQDSSVEVLAGKFKELAEENKTLKLAAKDSADKRVKELLDDAVKAGKIDAVDRPNYEALAAVNYDAVKAVIDKAQAPVDLAAFANNGKTQGSDAGNSEDLADEYRKLDKAGKLANLSATNPERFKALYKARFNKEYKA